ncbi:hypothetical protein [Acidimangrovimonas pyrenivorans]|uniref:Factor H binding protein C-terminal domain-containing protein n=1 Tax=Acidimangrovimonas pyrenivorans TaxID=2030798 RepID=A0ABV7AC13_9RHOB
MKFWHMAAVTLMAAGCSGNSLNNGGPSSGSSGGTGTTVDLPGSTTVSASSPISHSEKQDAATGDGYATNMTYDATNDTFTVDNLAFDGGNTYTRDTTVPNLGPYQVYEAASTYQDSLTGTPINQFLYRAIYARSTNKTADGKPTTEFAIVRTGAYVPYGFGGFMYQRNGSVVLPTSGQANYSGKYAGLRDFDGAAGLEYTTGDMKIAIDFNDFNDPAGVQGQISNRKIFDVNGNDITGQVLAALSTKTNVTQTVLPTAVFTVGPGTLSKAGEITNGITSTVPTSSGSERLETGKYYAVLSGKNAGEVVGIVVMTSADPRVDGVTVRETGGFILQRN